jgi:hypothetical protein
MRPRPHRRIPLVGVHQRVQLDQVEGIDAQAVERAVDFLTRLGVGALARLRRQKEVLAVTRHPRPDAQFSIAVGGRRVDMIDAIFEQQIERAVGLGLGHGAERGGAKERDGAHVAGAPKGTLLKRFA